MVKQQPTSFEFWMRIHMQNSLNTANLKTLFQIITIKLFLKSGKRFNVFLHLNDLFIRSIEESKYMKVNVPSGCNFFFFFT